MSLASTPSVGTTSSGATASSSATTATAQAMAASSSSSSGSGLTTSTTVGSLADLKKKSPQVYNMMMQGIAMNVCNDMQHHQERLKKAMRQSER